jgi:hypothetical protein
MSDAPERIQAWADRNLQWGPQWKCCPMPMHPMTTFGVTEYIRADLAPDPAKVQALVEALRQIADPISLAQGNINAEIACAALAAWEGRG